MANIYHRLGYNCFALMINKNSFYRNGNYLWLDPIEGWIRSIIFKDSIGNAADQRFSGNAVNVLFFLSFFFEARSKLGVQRRGKERKGEERRGKGAKERVRAERAYFTVYFRIASRVGESWSNVNSAPGSTYSRHAAESVGGCVYFPRENLVSG